MNISQVNTAIISGNFTNDQLTSVIDAVKFARARLADKNKAGLRIGDNVSFTSSKTGVHYAGTVQKVAIKFVTVKTNSGTWRVPASMLEVA